ncbi:hypothetical protein [Candidatus Hodgkinia cicadicola]
MNWNCIGAVCVWVERMRIGRLEVIGLKGVRKIEIGIGRTGRD